jgi:hypothetical protein
MATVNSAEFVAADSIVRTLVIMTRLLPAGMSKRGAMVPPPFSGDHLVVVHSRASASCA